MWRWGLVNRQLRVENWEWGGWEECFFGGAGKPPFASGGGRGRMEEGMEAVGKPPVARGEGWMEGWGLFRWGWVGGLRLNRSTL